MSVMFFERRRGVLYVERMLRWVALVKEGDWMGQGWGSYSPSQRFG